jgi:ABC-2 type transport system permease protein
MFFASLIISAPAIFFAVLGFTVSPVWHEAALLTGFIIGAAVLGFGILAGGSIFERRSPEILAAAMRN